MTWEHFKAIVWLRWRLTARQFGRSGIIFQLLGFALVFVAVWSSVTGFFLALGVGLFALPRTSADQLLWIWDVTVVAFLFFWMIGLLTELQRSEAISLNKLFHLPVSPSGAFLLNYLNSLATFTTLFFVPLMLGFTVALVINRGVSMLLAIPLLISFLLMVTSLTHQFRGWLASLMVNKRRRRTVVVIVTVGFIVMCQVPNAIHLAARKQFSSNDGPDKRLTQLDNQLADGTLTPDEHQVLRDEHVNAISRAKKRRREQLYANITRQAEYVNMAVPLGWLPYGIKSLDVGNVWPAILGTMGALVVGVVSLRRSYRTTIRLYNGGFQTGGGRRRAAVKQDKPKTKLSTKPGLLERRMPGTAEATSAVAMAALRSMQRAPESKLLLLSPIILIAIFGTVMLTTDSLPAVARPYVVFAGICLMLFTLASIMLNLFGYDRGGFRSYVLSPAPRQQILLGKNLALAPMAIVFGLVWILFNQFTSPLRWDHLIASLVQTVNLYVVLCILGNFFSVLAPMGMSSGTLRPAKLSFGSLFAHLVCTLLIPLVFIPSVLPLAIETALEQLAETRHYPIYLACTVIQLPLVLALMKFVLPHQGKLFQRREQKMLQKLTAVGQ